MGFKKVGGLWKKDGKNNKEFLSGVLELGAVGQTRVMVFENDKKGENGPDFTINIVTEEKTKEGRR